MTEYKSIEQESSFEFSEKKSKFIGYAKPVETEENAADFINKIKERHWDATHNVYAYIVKKNNRTKCSDDGEPHGTAGVPVLEVLQKNGLTNVVVVVTRYFGGTLLGTGGLARAYSYAAGAAVKSGGIIEFKKCYGYDFFCDYNQYEPVANIISSGGGVLEDTVFTDEIKVTFYVPCENSENIIKKTQEMTSGKVKPKFIGEKYYKI